MSSFIRIQDIADILIMTFLIYQMYSWFRKTRAIEVLLGLGVVTLIYFVTRFLGLYMTSWILQELGTVLIVLIIVVFQSEIRQTLYRFSLLRHFFGNRQETQQHIQFQEIAETLFSFAEKRTGAILVFQRDEALADQMLNGVRLDCEFSPQMLEAIFFGDSPLHDGAALIREGRIAKASCHLPLSANPDIPQYYGTRHRAALGLTERSDAVVLVVSEERGEVSLVVAGELQRCASPIELIAMLEELVIPTRELPRMTLLQRLFANTLPKAAILLLVTGFWVLITSRQGQVTTVSVPVRLHGIPEELVLVKSTPEEVNVQVKSFTSLAPPLAKLDIVADIDLSGIHEGQSTVRIKNSDVKIPSGVAVENISPPSIKLVTEKKVRKLVPVRIMVKGSFASNLRGYQLISSPSSVEVEGPAGQIARIDSVATEEIDAGVVVKGKEYSKNLQPAQKKVVVLRNEPVMLRLVPRRASR